MEENGVDWDVVYDDRGHFFEPHTDRSFGLGTISVRKYLAEVGPPRFGEPGFGTGEVETYGPDGCFGAVLFIEKEGFLPLFEKVHLAESYDLAIMSTKGMSSTAARSLIDNLCRKQVPLLLLHDFDKAGLSIAGTLQRNTRRFSSSITWRSSTSVCDWSTSVISTWKTAPKMHLILGAAAARRQNLRLNGATEEEIEFLLEQRVELNALTSGQLVAFIERKLAEHGISKVIPPTDLLGDAYRLSVQNARLERSSRRPSMISITKAISMPRSISASASQNISKVTRNRGGTKKLRRLLKKITRMTGRADDRPPISRTQPRWRPGGQVGAVSRAGSFTP